MSKSTCCFSPRAGFEPATADNCSAVLPIMYQLTGSVSILPTISEAVCYADADVGLECCLHGGGLYAYAVAYLQTDDY